MARLLLTLLLLAAAAHASDDPRVPQSTERLRAMLDFFRPELVARGFDVELRVSESPDYEARVYHYSVMRFHEIIISEGAMRLTGHDPDLLAVVMAHEVGHLLGKGPRDEIHLTTAEGEADFFSGQHYADLLRAGLLPGPSPLTRTQEHRESLERLRRMGLPAARQAEAARAVAAFIYGQRVFRPGAVFSWERPDPTVVSATRMDYPTPQGRFDTFLAGLLGRTRPLCWARPGDFTAKD